MLGIERLGLSPTLLPGLEAHPAVIAFVQGITLLLGAGLSLGLSRRMAGDWAWAALSCGSLGILAACQLWMTEAGCFSFHGPSGNQSSMCLPKQAASAC